MERASCCLVLPKASSRNFEVANTRDLKILNSVKARLGLSIG